MKPISDEPEDITACATSPSDTIIHSDEPGG